MMQFANYMNTENIKKTFSLNVNGCILWKCGEKILYIWVIYNWKYA